MAIRSRLQVEPLEARGLVRAEVMFQREHDEVDHVLHMDLDRTGSVSALSNDGYTDTPVHGYTDTRRDKGTSRQVDKCTGGREDGWTLVGWAVRREDDWTTGQM
jgi:hypothetical protein